MRVASSLTFVVLASAALSSQAPELIPAPYLSPNMWRRETPHRALSSRAGKNLENG
jgi:hypothetical protein